MRIRDITRLSWDQVRRRKVVTALCAAGISIGCAAIIVAMSIGESAQVYIEKEMNSFLKMDEITLSPLAGAPSSNSDSGDTEVYAKGQLTDQKLNVIRNLKHVKAASPFQQLNYFPVFTLDGQTSEYQTELIGTDLNMLESFGNEYLQGGPSDLTGTIVLSYGATLGFMTEDEITKVREQWQTNYYDDTIMEQIRNMNRKPSALLHKQIQLVQHTQEGKLTSSPLRVVGILKKPEGRSENSIMYDKRGYISIETAEMLKKELKLGGTENAGYSSIVVKVDSQSHIEKVENQLKKLTVNTQTNMHQMEAIEGQFKIIKAAALGIGIFILIIASISIVVAMTMSTYQRRRQIGIMKVLGANLAQIRNMFIVEAALLGFLGGLLGVLFSYWIVWAMNALIMTMSGEPDALTIYIPLLTIPVGMLFAIATGVVSGIYPAISASRTDALTAIRRD